MDEESTYLVDFNCSDDGQGLIVYQLQTNASWLFIDNITGVVNGTPRNSDVGLYWVNMTVEDGNSGLDFDNYTLEVINTNDAPIIITFDLNYTDEDFLYNVDYQHTDDDGDFVQWNLITNAPG